jgi:hypothetical protein
MARINVWLCIITLLFCVLPMAAQQPASTGYANESAAAANPDVEPGASLTGSGTKNFIPLFTSSTALGNSVLFQSSKKIGINTTAPTSTLDVNGAATVAGAFSLPAEGTATATAGSTSHTFNLTASAFSSTTSTAVNQTFQWQAEPAGNDTSTPSATLNLLFGEGATTPSETGLSIGSNGLITSNQLVSTVATGTPPLQVSSITLVPNLNASLLDGFSASAFAQIAAGNAFTVPQSISGTTNCGIGFECLSPVLGVYQSGTALGMVVENSGGGALIVAGIPCQGLGICVTNPLTTRFSVDNSGDGYFAGNVTITGSLAKGSGSFKIDHPLDPANKYLYHSFVESPDMMNIYNGNTVTDQRGMATVTLPDYFEPLNRDFRYQLTVIGQFAQAIVAKEISRSRFTIKTSKPGVKVSWQVTGIRHDAYADAHRIQVEEEKPPQEQGRYLHPELFGAPVEQAIGYHAPSVPTQVESARVSSQKAPSALPQ